MLREAGHFFLQLLPLCHALFTIVSVLPLVHSNAAAYSDLLLVSGRVKWWKDGVGQQPQYFP